MITSLYQSVGVVDAIDWVCGLCGLTFRITKQVEQWICITFCIKLEHSLWKLFRWFGRPQLWVIGSFITTTCPLMHHISCSFLVKHQITQVIQPLYSPYLVPYNFWIFPKWKSPLKGKRFQSIDEIQENMMGQLIATGTTVLGPKLATLKGTEASLSYVQCFFYLVSSSINISILYITWLDTSWTSYICVCVYTHIYTYIL